MVVLATATIILCSCRAPNQTATHWAPASPDGVLADAPLPNSGRPLVSAPPPGVRADVAVDIEPVAYEEPLPAPRTTESPPTNPVEMHPAGFRRPAAPNCTPTYAACQTCPPLVENRRPEDEYICDGGDQKYQARVRPDWSVDGLDLEDTIAHYDTIRGDVVVVPSNCVCIYSPRFGSVRQVTGMLLNDQVAAPAKVELEDPAILIEDAARAVSRLQNVQPELQLGSDRADGLRGNAYDAIAAQTLHPVEVADARLPFENLAIIETGEYVQSERAIVEKYLDAAIVWSHDLGVQVIVDEQAAVVDTGDQRAQAVVTVDEIPTKPKLRICKMASTRAAQPGDIVDFSIRFDNVGQQIIGNVTIIDNLTTRLEYVPDSAQASLAADFFTDENQGDSLVLRWEIRDPLKPGEGGVVSFRCRVR